MISLEFLATFPLALLTSSYKLGIEEISLKRGLKELTGDIVNAVALFIFILALRDLECTAVIT